MTPELYEPWLAQRPENFASSFDVNISALVKSHGRAVHLHGLPDVSCWTVSLHGRHGPLQLQIYKEKNGETGSELCDQCRIIGWQNHPVCHDRWHILVPVVEDMFVTATSTLDLPAVTPEGKQLMAIWDNLCQLLRARQISVEDVSNKGGMELRVLHAAAHKSTWYGQWGYQYGRGAFNITHSKWKKAVEAVHRAKIALMLADFAGIHSAVPSIVARYKVGSLMHSFSSYVESAMQKRCLPEECEHCDKYDLVKLHKLQGLTFKRFKGIAICPLCRVDVGFDSSKGMTHVHHHVKPCRAIHEQIISQKQDSH